MSYTSDEFVYRQFTSTDTYVRLSKRAVSSSFRYCTSSTISSSVHFRVDKFLTKGNSCATSMAGRLAEGAFDTRFYMGKCKLVYPDVARINSEVRTRNVAMTTRMTFSFTAALAMSVSRGITSYFLFR